MRRSRSRWSTAMSASHTGEFLPLVQFRTGAPNLPSASAPASRTALSIQPVSLATEMSASVTGNGETLHAHGRGIGAVAEREVVGRRQRAEHIEQVAGDGDLAHRIGEFAALDPEAGGAAAVVAGHQVDAHADQIVDVESFLDIGDQRIGRYAAGGKMQISGAR